MAFGISWNYRDWNWSSNNPNTVNWKDKLVTLKFDKVKCTNYAPSGMGGYTPSGYGVTFTWRF